MKQYKSIISIIIFLLTTIPVALAQERTDTTYISHTDSVLINFRQSKWNLDLNMGNNAAALDSIDSRLTTVLNDSVYRLRHVSVFGGASPEGTVAFNKFLSEHRAETLFNWFDKYNQLSDLDKTFTFYGRDWEGVLWLAEKDENIPYRDETLKLLNTLVAEKRALGGEDPKRSLERMKQLRGGIPYQYLYRNIFPTVRASKVVIDYDRILAPKIQQRRTDSIAMIPDTIYVDRVVHLTDTIYFNSCPDCPKQWHLSTNAIELALMIANLTGEWDFACHWSAALSIHYSAIDYFSPVRKFRTFIFRPEARWWPNTEHNGWFVDAHVQMAAYNFALPSWKYRIQDVDGTHPALGGGLGVGYRLPISRNGRWSLQGQIGVGVYALYYDRFENIVNGPLVDTKRRTFFGVDNVALSIVYNFNR